jgi:hypothetical protein
MDSEFYVYAYLNPNVKEKKTYLGYNFEYEVFYIGKGKGKRCYKHLNSVRDKGIDITNNQFKLNKIKKILSSHKEPLIVKIEKNLNEVDSLVLERNLIKEIGLRCDSTGSLVNISIPSNNLFGGDTFSANPNKEKRRKQMREAMVGDKNHMFGMPLEYFPSHKLKGKGHWNYNKKRTKEQRDKMSKNRKWKLNKSSKNILQFDIDGNFIKEWDSLISIKKELGFNSSAIITVCKGEGFSSNNFIWRYKVGDLISLSFCFLKTKRQGCLENLKRQDKGCRQICLQTGKVLKEFSSIVKAEREVGSACISKSCTGKIHKTGGFTWEFLEKKEREKYVKIKKNLKEKVEASSLSRKKCIIQKDLNGNVVKVWSSITEASKVTGFNKGSLGQCCNGKRYKTVGGFKWEKK